MSADLSTPVLPRIERALRIDGQQHARPALRYSRALATPLLAALAITFVLVGAGSLDLGPADARLGLAAGAPLGPMGQVYGLWAPQLWPGRVAVCKLASLLEEFGRPSPGSVLVPAALAAVAAGWVLIRRLTACLGTRAGIWMGLCWFGCVGVIDHSGGTGLEFLSGLPIVAAIDRLIGGRSDWIAGLWTALAFAMGGWTAVALILLAVIVISRREASFSMSLLLPPSIVAAAWMIWMLLAGSTDALAAALAWPFTEPPDWWLAPTLILLGLPFAPIAVLAVSRSTRERWSATTKVMVAGWAQVALACLVAGTIVPGLAQAARVPALAGIMLVSATGLEAAWTRGLAQAPRRVLHAITGGLVVLWTAAMLYSGYVWLLVLPYYRPVGIAALLISLAVLVLGWRAWKMASNRRAVLAMATLALALKLVHCGYFVPELNYQRGQGPWGRAIGQWLLPSWTLHTIHEWPWDLTFAIGRPVRQLVTPRHLAFPEDGKSKHVLLLESEYQHWPEDAPRLLKVATFHDRRGARRILARTEGVLVTPSGAWLWDETSP
jgi:hypothetical protein